MKLKKGLKLRSVGSRYMIVDGQGDVEDMACVYSLNGVAAFLWQKAAEGEFTVDSLADMLCLEYEVEREAAVEDVCAMLAQWREYGLTDEQDA